MTLVEARNLNAQATSQMNSFWGNLYDHFKDRRYGALFLVSLVAFLGVLVLGAVIEEIFRAFDLQEYFLQALPGVGILAAAWVWRGVRQERARRREQLRHSPLSRDELRVARSKLLKDRNLKKS